MFPFLKKNQSNKRIGSHFKVDMHSHILPGIDDGAESVEQSLSLINSLINEGYEKLIATPHIMSDFYQNTSEIISEKLELINNTLRENNINIKIEAAAEYFLDESFMKRLHDNEKLLSFGEKYVLFETSFMNSSPYLNDAIFLMQSVGYKPVLAHPERYIYFYNDFQGLVQLYDKGVFLQINTNSLTGYYGKPAQKVAEKLIDLNMVSFAGTDCHSEKHILALEKIYKTNYYKKLLNIPLLNTTL